VKEVRRQSLLKGKKAFHSPNKNHYPGENKGERVIKTLLPRGREDPKKKKRRRR